VILERIMPPGLRAMTAADIEADAEASTRRPQHDDAGGDVGVRLLEHALERKPHVHRQRVELVGTIERNEPDLLVGRVEHEVVAHQSSTSFAFLAISGGAE
jgi:hypothetical protein